MSRNEVLNEILAEAKPEQCKAVRELESRGFSIFYHFDVEDAEEILGEMNRAFDGGILYEWAYTRLGIEAAL